MVQKLSFRLLLVLLLLPLIGMAQALPPQGTAVINGETVYFVGQEDEKDLIAVKLRPGTQEEISKTRPSAIRKILAIEGEIVKQTTLRFVPESYAFFLAIGAVNYAQLIFNYSGNPASIEQHIQSLKDPIGHLGFYTFMLANRQAGAILSAASKNPVLNRHVFPFLGMGAGMMASNIVHEVASDKNLIACAKSVFQNDNSSNAQKSCDKAYDTWVNHFHEKSYNFAIQLATLGSSTYLSQKIHKKISGTAAKRYLEIYGVEMAVGLIPGTLPFKVVKWVGTVGNFAMFTQLDQWIAAIIRPPVNNFLLGNDFYDLSKSLTVNLLEKKNNGWLSDIDVSKCLFGGRADFIFGKNPNDCGDKLLNDLQEFTHQMGKWREMNLEKVYAAHNSWLSMVNRVVGTYAFSQTTYNSFLGLSKNPTAPQNPLSTIIPLWGISTETFKDQQNMLTTRLAGRYIDAQMAHIEKVNTWIGLMIADGSIQTLLPKDKSIVLEIRDQLASKNVNTAAQGLVLLNKSLKAPGISPDLLSFLTELRQKLGNPRPVLRMGEFFTVINDHNEKVSENPSLSSWGLHTGDFPAETPTEKIISNMICAGDRAEVRKSTGFTPYFVPPKIVDQSNILQCTAGVMRPTIPFSSFQILEPNGELHPNAVQYILQHLKPEFKQGSPSDWWKNQNDPVLYSWFNSEKYEYNNIIGGLLEKFHSKQDSVFNRTGYVSNGIADNYKQEMKVYLLILGDILKNQKETGPTVKAQLTRALFSDKKEPAVRTIPSVNDQLPFLKIIRNNDNLNLNQILGLSNQDISEGRTIKIFDNLNTLVKEIDAAFPQAKWEKENSLSRGSRMVIRSNLRNSDIEKIKEKLLGELETLSMVVDATVGNKFQRTISAYCIKSLMDIFGSYSSLAQITNLMDFEKNRIDDGKKSLEQKKQICLKNTNGKNALVDKTNQNNCEE